MNSNPCDGINGLVLSRAGVGAMGCPSWAFSSLRLAGGFVAPGFFTCPLSSLLCIRLVLRPSLEWKLSGVRLAMCPKEIGKARDMDVSAARTEHQALIGRLMQGPGDGDGAMHRAERLVGLPYWSQWNLRHKRRASVPFMQQVRFAYLSLVEQSVRRDIERLRTEQAKGAADADLKCLVAEAEDLLARIKARAAT